MNLGLFGAAIYRAILIDQLITQSPEQGGGCRCLPNLLDRLWFSLHQLWPYPPQPIAWRLSSRFRPLSPGRLGCRRDRAPTSHNAAARRLLHSPTAGALEPPICWPPRPPPPSSQSSPPPRRATAPTAGS